MRRFSRRIPPQSDSLMDRTPPETLLTWLAFLCLCSLACGWCARPGTWCLHPARLFLLACINHFVPKSMRYLVLRRVCTTSLLLTDSGYAPRAGERFTTLSEPLFIASERPRGIARHDAEAPIPRIRSRAPMVSRNHQNDFVVWHCINVSQPTDPFLK